MNRKKSTISGVVLVSSALLLAACNESEENTSANENNMNQINEENMNENDMNDGDMDHNNMNENNMNHHDMNDENMDQETNEAREDFEEEAAELPEDFNEGANENLQTLNTKNVTRLDASSIEEMTVTAAQTIWPATHEANQPGAVILADAAEWQHALAALTLVHHPNDGPLLLMEDGLTEELISEIERLNPLGNEEGIEVLAAAELTSEEEELLEGFEVHSIYEEDPAEFAGEVENQYAETIGELPESVIIGSMEEEHQASSLLAGSWIAHMDESLLYVNEEIPEATAEALEAREGEANIYLLGNEEAISEEIAEELQEYGNVERVEGETPVELSIAFASYQDDNFGWGIDEPGHGLVFASPEESGMVLPGLPLAHLGKHAPLIWVEEDELEQAHADYLAQLKPSFEEVPMEGPYNHAYILGNEDTISYQNQGIIDQKLEIEALGDGGHGGH
ncbi:cell wall-binding repeat-containing protein [Bacillus daqingensis]|uniref:Cell wall-binding repeat-containing protein n=2 Tax=Bacillus daqingensis TaxID=872396 RepID=A0ABV9NP71_9BACI